MASVETVVESRIAPFELGPRYDAAIVAQIREFAERVSRFPFVKAIELWQGPGLVYVSTAVAPWGHALAEAILAVQFEVTGKHRGAHVDFHLVNVERRTEKAAPLGPMTDGTTVLWRCAEPAAS